MEPDLYSDCTNDGGEELFSIIHKIDSTEIVYSQPEIKYRLVGPYIKGDLLGEGSYGKVKECIHSRTLQRCAIKIMKHRTLRRIPNGEQNVHREIQLLRGLNHKNVIHLIEVMHITDKQKIYMVMDYCVTGLQEMLDSTSKKKFPQWQSHKYFLQLAEGLEYLHSKGVIHKDIKPGNLLLTTNSTLKIIDFGVAEQIEAMAEDDTITTSQGSPVFQPPEVAGGAEKFPGFKVDVWSAGVTLFNMCSGSYPFDGANVFRLYESICEKPIEIPSDLDVTLQRLLEGMLLKNPYDRLSIQEVRKHEWCLRKQVPNHEAEVPLVSKKSKGKRYTAIDVIRYQFYEEDEQFSNHRQFITEHELNESRQREEERQQQELTTPDSSEDAASQHGQILKTSKKRKPLSCINIKGLPSCSQS
ncbi:UNVERIFIED_CONTAM: hypothetical protein RMT77_016453 [Armadillidium vulgare]